MYLRSLNSTFSGPTIGLSKLKSFFVEKQYEDKMATLKIIKTTFSKF